MTNETQSVWLCMYYHANGTDVIAHDSEASADAGALCLMVEGLGEVYDAEKRRAVVAEILAGRYGEAFALYAEATDETFETFSTPIIHVAGDEAVTELRARWVDDTGEES